MGCFELLNTYGRTMELLYVPSKPRQSALTGRMPAASLIIDIGPLGKSMLETKGSDRPTRRSQGNLLSRTCRNPPVVTVCLIGSIASGLTLVLSTILY